MNIAAGTTEAFKTVYLGLQKSADILGENLSNNSVSIIQHKYGRSAGNIASKTFSALGNIITVGRNVHLLSPVVVVNTITMNSKIDMKESDVHSQPFPHH